MIVDLRSDTVTQPTPEMLSFMLNAKVGDDVLGDDPTVNELEAKVAKLFNKEAALYCPSGTMANQVAIKTHTKPGDEIICHEWSHIFVNEAGGLAFHSGLSTKLLRGNNGRIFAADVEDCINPPNQIHRPHTKIVSVENTMNKGGGALYDFKELEKIGQVCKKHNLKYHLDGARIFNALIETSQNTFDYGNLFDSISICFSKGLGAPVGSVIVGNKEFISEARRYRKLFGGAMRQAGYLAAACIFALDNNINRLSEDHRRAKDIENLLKKLDYVETIEPVETNIIYFNLNKNIQIQSFIEYLKDNGVLSMAMGKHQVRFVTHLGITDKMIDKTLEVLKSYK